MAGPGLGGVDGCVLLWLTPVWVYATLGITVADRESLARLASSVLHPQHPEAIHQPKSSSPSGCPEHVDVLKDILWLVCAAAEVPSTRAVAVHLWQQGGSEEQRLIWMTHVVLRWCMKEGVCIW